jgi:hypothetical protein
MRVQDQNVQSGAKRLSSACLALATNGPGEGAALSDTVPYPNDDITFNIRFL